MPKTNHLCPNAFIQAKCKRKTDQKDMVRLVRRSDQAFSVLKTKAGIPPCSAYRDDEDDADGDGDEEDEFLSLFFLFNLVGTPVGLLR